MKCPYCGTVIRPDEKICSGCGYKNPEYNPNAYKEPKKEEPKPLFNIPVINNTTDNTNNKTNNTTNNNTTTKGGPNVIVLIILILFCWPVGLIYLLTSVSKK